MSYEVVGLAVSRRSRLAGRADEEVLHRKDGADQRYMHIDWHVDRSSNPPVRSGVAPIVRGREGPFDLEIAGQVGPEVVKRLDIAERVVHLGIAMTKVPVRDDKSSVVGQNLLHDQHAEYGFPDSTQVQIERSVYGKIAWHF